MRELRFSYTTRFFFEQPVCDHSFALRCVPMDTPKQKICIEERYIEPADCIDETIDSFGNHKYVGRAQLYHKTFSYGVAGTAIVQSMMVQEGPLEPMYKFNSPFTRETVEMRNFFSKLEIPGGDKVEQAVFLMNVVHKYLEYAKEVTTIHTTAGEAFLLGKGVCQDYAHLMIAMCRMAGIPARYIVGMMIGEGYTHAWVEIYTGKGWYGLDPTNNLHIDDYYIKLAQGRDYGDCIVDQGNFRGLPGQWQEIKVSVEEIK